MTVIAAYSICNFPIIFGDLLLTGTNEISSRIVAVPAQGEVQEFFGSTGWGISGLAQKVNIINDSCVVAWAGSWVGARVAIAGLRDLGRCQKLTCEDILKFLDADPDLKSHSASFVGLVHEGGLLRQFRYSAEEFESASLGTVYLSGSGAAALYEFSHLLAGVDMRMTGSANEPERAIAQSLMLGGLLLQSEFRGGDAAATLRSMFGGGYEIAFFSHGRMQKLPEVTYVVWEAHLTGDDVYVSLPQLVVKQRYAGDYLLIRSAHMAYPGGGVQPQVVDEQRHIIGPMYETAARPSIEDLVSVSLQSQLLCHCIIVHREAETIGIYTRVQAHSQNSEASITFEDKDGQLVFGFRNDTVEEIVHALKQYRKMEGANAPTTSRNG